MISKLLTILLYTFIIDAVVSFGLNDGGGDGMNKIHLSSYREDNDDANNNRRRIFLSSMLTTSILVGSSSPAYAAKGAAEYDLEYYMRDLFMGNNKEGNLPVSNGPPPHPPRTIKEPLLSLLLDDELQSCIAIQELAKISKIPIDTIAEQTKAVRSKVQSAFKVSHPFVTNKVSDEYYFDLTCYSLWRVASQTPGAIQDFTKRDVFIRNIGMRLLDEIISKELISKDSIDLLQNKKELTLTDTVPIQIEILNLFQSTNFCTKYCLGDQKDEVRTGLNVFDSLDDDEIKSGGSVDCLVSIFDPSTLGGALQITGEGSRFAPGKSAFVLFYVVNSCVQYEDSAIRILHLNLVCLYVIAFACRMY